MTCSVPALTIRTLISFSVILSHSFKRNFLSSFFLVGLSRLTRCFKIRHMFSIELRSDDWEDQLSTKSRSIAIFVSRAGFFKEFVSWSSSLFSWKIMCMSFLSRYCLRACTIDKMCLIYFFWVILPSLLRFPLSKEFLLIRGTASTSLSSSFYFYLFIKCMQPQAMTL